MEKQISHSRPDKSGLGFEMTTGGCHLERAQNERSEFRKTIMKLRRRFYGRAVPINCHLEPEARSAEA